jgi:hypothetical protein
VKEIKSPASAWLWWTECCQWQLLSSSTDTLVRYLPRPGSKRGSQFSNQSVYKLVWYSGCLSFDSPIMTSLVCSFICRYVSLSVGRSSQESAKAHHTTPHHTTPHHTTPHHTISSTVEHRGEEKSTMRLPVSGLPASWRS